jgi:hypothetical protein
LGKSDQPRLVAPSHLDCLLQISDNAVGYLDARLGRLCDVLRKLDEVFDLDAVGPGAQSWSISCCRICFSGEFS